jgi:hypothetical protein
LGQLDVYSRAHGARCCGFRIVESGVRASRIVAGFLLAEVYQDTKLFHLNPPNSPSIFYFSPPPSAFSSQKGSKKEVKLNSLTSPNRNLTYKIHFDSRLFILLRISARKKATLKKIMARAYTGGANFYGCST